ncbi:hypothetical protein, partial [Streptomyces sp. URMC 123]|uniref:hypothetical protein n=1 Tax=Streptomyces sp. URMC 123 TaxID=3423403 RepID=UPI003F1DDA9E
GAGAALAVPGTGAVASVRSQTPVRSEAPIRPDAASARRQRDSSASTERDWQVVAVPPAVPPSRLHAVAAAGPDMAWAVGSENIPSSGPGRPMARHWDGRQWLATDTRHLAFAGSLHSVAAQVTGSRVTAWAVGTENDTGSHPLRWDGYTWRPVDHPGQGDPDTRLTSVALGPDGSVWFSALRGGGCTVLHHDPGGGWRWLEPVPADRAHPARIRTRPDGSVWLVGSQPFQGWLARFTAVWDGAWTVLPTFGGLHSLTTDVLALAPDDVWTTGNAYGIGGPPDKPPGVHLMHWDGGEWDQIEGPLSLGSLNAIVDDAQGRPAWTAGWNFWDRTRAAYLRWDGGAWVSAPGPQGAGGPVVSDLARVPGTDTFWSVGTTILQSRSDMHLHIERFA